MGPTASGKTDFAISLCKRFPCDIISVDSALVYRGMNIGTAKPDTETLKRTPHRLIDIRDPEESYSAGDFVRDARAEMESIFAHGRIPLLVGGTMMYFRALTEGIAELPMANEGIRREIDNMAEISGWPAVHAELEAIDAISAERINPNDSQRIQRALEVYKASGKSLTEWQQAADTRADDTRYLKIALQIEPRKLLHERIALRLDQMVDSGFVDELRRLRERPGVMRDSPAMRAVGYRQFWKYLENECSLDEARERALFATRQLAKRQLTWLRSERAVFMTNPLEVDAIDTISKHLAQQLG
ncbi:MAG: tRNA (adenosine(37)-N6)-dimethylallyltransferase MiaA [Gammaproteobacteria bacterium]|nr:tRNA (adenosine(37)-N6)-dimethylallyltransferase MiaA [Gammaproteobacteria bacterium]MBT8110211.1 tRNA (adenosine(37)-N6)-dimethylallyltransferase MiaA [Gammaproteobacteria bacterium]NND48561.1 tRNA (adenosine(37)-N6)-dimethylallyltransferase MiaA [Woeseiaceae bacterium]NNL44914.1 tRNA (adenosine(37)-N6)-dimethylallyltransferase MiaA [Woeseiaceae bacterium]